VVKADRILTKLFWDGKLTFYRNWLGRILDKMY
jgi:hypothetical protein